MRAAFLGLGKMGIAVATVLQESGHALTVWNRTSSAAAPLKEAGARVAATPAEAVQDMPVVLSMLSDDAATEAVVFGEGERRGIIDCMSADAVHLSLSTISVKLSRRLTEAHRERGRHFVAAPVFGRPIVAAQGKLWIAVAGARAAIDRVRPLLEAASRGISIVSEEPWQAHALKLGGNFLISAMIQALSEGFVFAESQGIDPDRFLETVNQALFQSPFYAQYGKTILHPPPQPGATVALGIKDTALFREAAAAANRDLQLAAYIADQLRRAEVAGRNDEDWAVAQYRTAQSVSQRKG